MYKVEFTKSAIKELSKLDKPKAREIKAFVLKNLVDTIDPRLKGKELTGNLKGIWNYRVGEFRLLARIEDDKLIIFVFKIADRKEVYRRI